MLPYAPARAIARALAVAVVVSIGGLIAASQASAADPAGAVLDRTNDRPVGVTQQTARAQDGLRRTLGAWALVQSDPATGTARIVARLDGFLTAASPRDPESIALDYVREHADAFGLDAGAIASLRLTTRARGPDGTVHLAWEQRSGGLVDVDGGLSAAVTAAGRLLNVRGGAVPDPGTSPPQPRVSAASAYATALPGTESAPSAASSSDTARTTSFDGGGSAALVRYRDDGVDRVGWRLLIPAGSSAFYDAIVDASTGRLQRRINRVRFAEIRHFDLNPRAENGASTVDPVPPLWLDPGGSNLSGPYVHAISDVDDRIALAQSTPPFALTAQPEGADEVSRANVYDPAFTINSAFCTAARFCTWSASNRTANREFSTAQLFWYVNRFHDHVAEAPIGFTAESGGLEGQSDRVLAQALDGAGSGGTAQLPASDDLNNASMLTLPDGYGALLEVNLFALGSSRYDGAHDAGLIYHEYAHGLTDRLVTDAQGFSALSGPQPGAVSEGSSDFYALDFLAETEPVLMPDTAAQGEVRLGNLLQQDPAATGLSGTLRTEGVDCAPGNPAGECPGTPRAGPGGYDYADFGRIDTAPEVHDDGEIWAQTLWGLRTALVNTRADGLERTRAYITGGLRLVPANPTFLDMRNAIVQAAVNLNGTQDWTTIWQVFARRGMGWSAATNRPDDLSPSAAYDVPPLPDSSTGGAPNTDVSEIEATGTPVPVVATPQPAPPAKVTALLGAKLEADRKGFIKVKVGFADTAPAGRARLTVLRKGKRLARTSTPVRRGGTATVTLRLSTKGRRMIKPGRTKRVTLELRLPGGQQLKKTLRLTRAGR
jgi:hypothetical protein